PLRETLSRLLAEREDKSAPLSQKKFKAIPPQSFKEAIKAVTRSELRNVEDKPTYFERHYPSEAETLRNYTVVLRQFEKGIHKGLWAKLGSTLARFVSQLTMTGGLGALMFDWAEAIRKVVTRNVLMIHPLHYDWIKGKVPDLPHVFQRPDGKRKMGFYLRRELKQLEDIDIPIRLNVTHEFRQAAVGKAKDLLSETGHKKIHLRVYYTETAFLKTPEYYLDAYFLKDENLPDTDENEQNRERIFDGLYPDYIWRDVQMAVYGQASDKLVTVLQKKGLAKEKIIFVDNEVYVSLPTPEHPNAIRQHVNHTAVKFYKPEAASFDLLAFPRWIYSYIVKDGEINIPTYVALTYNAISGVAVLEHDLVLRRLFFASAQDKLKALNRDGVRNTNGVFFGHWQAREIREFINQYRKKLNLDEEATAQVISQKLTEDPVLLQEFKTRMDYIKALLVAKFLMWLEQEQKQDNSLWLVNTLIKFDEKRSKLGLDVTEDARTILDHFKARIEAALQSEPEWNPLIESQTFNVLKEALLEDPIVSNVRRQVPYKGTDEWLTILRSLEKNPKELEEFKQKASRQVLGGRPFGFEALADFYEMKRLIHELQLEDRFATIDNYNLSEADRMIQAMAGIALIAFEFMEASATSQMKGIANWAALLGVWGGANPELFVIAARAVANGVRKIVDVFDKVFNFETFYDSHLVKNLGQTWEIINGWLVKYSSKMSNEPGGGRKPDAESLVEGLKWLASTYRDPQKRQQLMFNVFAASDRADIELSQAPALGLIWVGAIQSRGEQEKTLAAVPFSLDAAEKMFPRNDETAGKGFVWKDGNGMIYESAPGLSGLIDGFYALHSRTKAMSLRAGQKEVEVTEAGISINYHASQPVDHSDNIFPYLKGVLGELFPEANPLTERINELAKQAENLQEAKEKAKVYLEAIRWVDLLVFRFASQLFDAYWAEEDPERAEKLARYFGNNALKKNVVRYLESRPDFVSVDPDQAGVRAFTVHEPGKPAKLLHLNLSTIPVPDRYAGGQSKAFGNIMPGESIKKLFGEEAFGDPFVNFQVRDGKKVREGRKVVYGTYVMFDLRRSGLHFATPSPEDIQVLELVQGEEKISSHLSAAIKNERLVEGAAPVRLLVEELKRLMEKKPSQLKPFLTQVASLEKRRAAYLFTPDGIPIVMALISFLAPDLLDQMRDWDGETFNTIDELIKKNKDLFEKGSLKFHFTDRSTALVISKSFGKRHIFASMQFFPEAVDPKDGKVRSWVYGLGNLEWNVLGKYVPKDFITEERFRVDTPYSGADLRNSNGNTLVWHVGISTKKRSKSDKTIPRVQFLELEEVDEAGNPIVSSDAAVPDDVPKRAELRNASAAAESNLRLAYRIEQEEIRKAAAEYQEHQIEIGKRLTGAYRKGKGEGRALTPQQEWFVAPEPITEKILDPSTLAPTQTRLSQQQLDIEFIKQQAWESRDYQRIPIIVIDMGQGHLYVHGEDSHYRWYLAKEAGATVRAYVIRQLESAPIPPLDEPIQFEDPLPSLKYLQAQLKFPLQEVRMIALEAKKPSFIKSPKRTSDDLERFMVQVEQRAEKAENEFFQRLPEVHEPVTKVEEEPENLRVGMGIAAALEHLLNGSIEAENQIQLPSLKGARSRQDKEEYLSAVARVVFKQTFSDYRIVSRNILDFLNGRNRKNIEAFFSTELIEQFKDKIQAGNTPFVYYLPRDEISEGLLPTTSRYLTSYPSDELFPINFILTFEKQAFDHEITRIHQSLARAGGLTSALPHDILFAEINKSVANLLNMVFVHKSIRPQVERELQLAIYSALLKKTGVQKRAVELSLTAPRDGPQSNWSSKFRGRTIRWLMARLIDLSRDGLKFNRMETWGGNRILAAMSPLFFGNLPEDPWFHLRRQTEMLKEEKASEISQQMLMRGTYVVSLETQPDDVVKHFSRLAVQDGVDIFRDFDAFTDTRKIEKALRFVEAAGGRTQPVIHFTPDFPRGVAGYVWLAKKLLANRDPKKLDSLVIKDAAGLLEPKTVFALVKGLREAGITIPIQLHTHDTFGNRELVVLEFIRAGGNIIDFGISKDVLSSPFAQPDLYDFLV
ncbi:MAG: hypothetical protein HY583_00115, partial [Candidatus Omnitrophica bacterium]|nr:hypothetical protein [Candidatus Omnitrophota bacterium]